MLKRNQIVTTLAVLAFFGCFALTKERVVEAQPAKGAFWSDVATLIKNDQWVIVALLGLVLSDFR